MLFNFKILYNYLKSRYIFKGIDYPKLANFQIMFFYA